MAKGNSALGQFLAVFSIGLGLAEVTASEQVAALAGVRDMNTNRNWFKAVGLRELAVGALLLLKSRSATLVWSRVAGDAMDLSLLGAALVSAKAEANKDKTIRALATVAAITLLDIYTAKKLSQLTSAE